MRIAAVILSLSSVFALLIEESAYGYDINGQLERLTVIKGRDTATTSTDVSPRQNQFQ